MAVCLSNYQRNCFCAAHFAPNFVRALLCARETCYCCTTGAWNIYPILLEQPSFNFTVLRRNSSRSKQNKRMNFSIGVDFDNTIACYDTAFSIVAHELGLVDFPISLSKAQIKEVVLARPRGNLDWQKLQGQVYGKHVHLATVFRGFVEFLCRSKLDGHSVFIVSHKSEYGHFDNKQVNLRDAALTWMIHNQIIGSDGIALLGSEVFFESTRLEKLARIRTLDCTLYIDDLAEVLEDPRFPDSTEKFLFAPAGSVDTRPRLSVESSWRMLTYRLFGNLADDEVRRISQRRLPSLDVDRVTPKPGRGKSRIFKLESSDGKRYALKIYPDRQLDLRPRLETEFLATHFLGAAHFPVTPAAAKDDGLNWAVYDWVLGKTPSSVDNAFIDQALEFREHLWATSRREIGCADFSEASEACLSGAEIVSQIEQKFARLILVAPPKVILFLNHDLQPILFARGETARGLLSESFDVKLPPAQQILSPSDFGAHNSIKDVNGRYIFIDFEYFGWDDPVKLVSDFYWHPAMNLTQELKTRWLTSAKSIFMDDPSFIRRLDVFLPLIGIRWCLILLNEFLPSALAQRVNADPSRLARTVSLLANQLRTSKELLQVIQNLSANGPAIQTS